MIRGFPVFYGWVMLPAVILMSFSSAGARFSFGVFVGPMQHDLHWTLGQLADVAALNLLLAGLLRPIAGNLIDRVGSRAVALLGLAIASTSMFLTSQVHELWQFYLTYGFLLALGYALASPVVTTTLISSWFVERRALALSIGSTGAGFGELVIVPVAAVLIGIIGWQASYQAIGAFIAIVVLPAAFLLIRNSPADLGLEPLGGRQGQRGRASSLAQTALTLRQALRLPDLWRLAFGMFVCGLTMSFASTHFVPFAMEMDFEPMAAASALGLVGLWSILGSLVSGMLADRLGRKNVLSAVYFLRGMSFVVLLYAHNNPIALYWGAFLLGISWTSTTPLTSAITADRCGLRYLGTIFGTVFTVMPIGSAIGASLAGRLHDLSGGYEWSLVISAAAGFLAALVVSGVRGPGAEAERRPPAVVRPTPSTSSATSEV